MIDQLSLRKNPLPFVFARADFLRDQWQENWASTSAAAQV